MAINAIKTDTPAMGAVGDGSPNRPRMNVSHAANTGAVLHYVIAPVSGVLERAKVAASVTSDATKTYTFVITNVTKSDVMTAAAQVFDADPVLTAGTAADLVLDSTGVAVSAGDLISVSMAGGTGSGLTACELTFKGRE